MTVADDFGLAPGDLVSDLEVPAPYHRRLAPVPAIIMVFVLVEAFETALQRCRSAACIARQLDPPLFA